MLLVARIFGLTRTIYAWRRPMPRLGQPVDCQQLWDV